MVITTANQYCFAIYCLDGQLYFGYILSFGHGQIIQRALYRQMTPEQLIKFRKMMGYTQHEMSNSLGYCSRAYQKMEYGRAEIRPSIALACCAMALGIDRYKEDVVASDYKNNKQG